MKGKTITITEYKGSLVKRSFFEELKNDIREAGNKPATALDWAMFYVCVVIGMFILVVATQ